MWVIAGPAIFKGFSTFGVTVIAQAFIGHIGATELAAFSLVNTLLLRFANGILVCFFLSFHFTMISIVHFSCIPLFDKTQSPLRSEKNELFFLIEKIWFSYGMVGLPDSFLT